ncbi:DUF2357 domain-containing protein [Helicobacter rodentium]|uniref:DUF2357 domain-containing protein n=1 Tax=Helicobacter rodentium TaxID=59617 RepID=UPI00263B5B58|nr:DUF2357 domain-containing protein [Helicobacter rodentium]
MENYDFSNYDDLFYILNMLEDAFRHISQHISSQIRRTHKIMPLSQARELDGKSIEWIAKQNGITIKQKLAQGKVLGVKRYNFIDNPENRVFKIVLMRLITIAEFGKFDEELLVKIKRFVKNNLVEVNHKAQIIPNNILLHHKHYGKFYKAYKWLNHLESIMNDFKTFKSKVLKTREELKKIIVLSLLHKYTNARILPSDLKINQKEYSIEFESKWLLDINLNEYINNEYINNEKSLKDFKLKALELIRKDDKIKRITPPPNKINSKDSNIFMDMFRLYPLAYIDSKQITMPLLLKQKIDNKTINANHTKIIDRNYEFHTLPESLLLKNSEVFSIFLSDIKEFVGESNSLFYVLPDYITNIFDFNDKHRSIRTYFNKAFFINKSILAAAKMLLQSQLNKDDTLLYFQKNNEGEIFVTPILVRYKDELKNSKSKGLYLEKHPSKQIKSSHKNTDKLVQELLEKCLQNGLKALNKNNIKYYKNNKVYDMPTLQAEKPNNDIEEVKRLYKNSKSLFRKGIRIIQDDPKENLIYFAELIQQKEAGFKLWGERLPKLDIGIESDFEMKKFNLVNENSELDFSNAINIKEQFIIPANEASVSAPLFLEDKNIKYYMLLESHIMPFKEKVRCSLTLQYSYENENIYTLIFTPLDKNLPQIQAKWHKGEIKQKRKDMSKIYPPYPDIKSIDELQHYPKKDGSGENNLFEWVETSLKRIQKELTQKEKISATIYHIKRDFCFAKDEQGDEIFCHKDRFINQAEWENINEGDVIYLIKREVKQGCRGESISFDSSYQIEQATKILSNTRFPMICIFNGHSLRDNDMPDSFRTAIGNFMSFMEQRDINDKNFKNEFLFFCSTMHDCSPISEYLVDKANNVDNANNIETKLLAYSIGNAKLPWQKEILDSVCKNEFTKQVTILAISLWRSEDLVFKIDDNIVKGLIEKSIRQIIENKLSFYKPKNSNMLYADQLLTNILEVLLSLLRLRQKGFDILNPSDENTEHLIQKLLELSQTITQKKATLKSYLNLEVEKPSKYKEMPDLIYALPSFIKGENSDSIKIIGVNDEA